MEKVKILAGRILVDPVEVERKTGGGLIIPANVNKRPSRGTVVVVGNSFADVEMEVSVGDIAVFREGTGAEIEVTDKVDIKQGKYLLMEQREVLYFI